MFEPPEPSAWLARLTLFRPGARNLPVSLKLGFSRQYLGVPMGARPTVT